MSNKITESVMNAWRSGRKTRTASKGWITANAPCCTHRGETPDRRSRGGLLLTPEGGFSYHCFNCNYTTGWKPGSHLGYRVRNLLSWMGMQQDQIQLLVFEAMRAVDRTVVQQELQTKSHEFKTIQLPDSAPIADLVAAGAHLLDHDLKSAVDFVHQRGFQLEDYNWHWSPSTEHGLNRRVIVPCTWQNRIVGYTARSVITDSKIKYFNQYDSDYVFNIDAQTADREFVVVTEGVLDAVATDGVAVLTNEINENKAEIIESLGRQIIVVPDRDRSGQQLVEQAVEYGWAVSFPLWESDVKDAAEAHRRYGKLYTLRSILTDVETSGLKIKLRSREIFS